MDDKRFDGLVAAMARGASRRGAARALAGLGLASALAPVLDISDTAARRRKKKRCRCSACQTCRKGRCTAIADGTACGLNKTCAGGSCTCDNGRDEIAGRCTLPCTAACSATVNCCNKTFDTGLRFCGFDYRPCESALPCTSHRGCSTGELCGQTGCDAVNGVTNKCVDIC
jgi:hypothetical protein